MLIFFNFIKIIKFNDFNRIEYLIIKNIIIFLNFLIKIIIIENIIQLRIRLNK